MRRTKASNLPDVGQMRSRKGTSMKRIKSAEALWKEGEHVSWGRSGGHRAHSRERERGVCNVQGKGAEDDLEGVDGKDVGNAQRKAENHGQDSEPREIAAVSIKGELEMCATTDCLLGELGEGCQDQSRRSSNREGLPLCVDAWTRIISRLLESRIWQKDADVLKFLV